MSETIKTVWFLFCEDAHSNEVVSSTLNGLQASSDFKEHECADGKTRPLYQVPDYNFASRMHKSQKQLAARLQIFRAQDNGKPAKWVFEKPKKPSVEALIRRSNAIKTGPFKKTARNT